MKEGVHKDKERTPSYMLLLQSHLVDGLPVVVNLQHEVLTL